MTVMMLETITIAKMCGGVPAEIHDASQATAANGGPQEGAANGAAETNGEKR